MCPSEPRDFTLASSTVRFGAGQRRACYNQTIVDDKDPEPTETFAVRIVDNADAAAGNPSVAQISINDFDGSKYGYIVVHYVTSVWTYVHAHV